MNAAYYAANRERALQSMAAWRAANMDRKRENDAKWRRANCEKVQANIAAWRAANYDKYIAYNTKYVLDRKKRDPAYNMAYRLRVRLHHALAGASKAATTMELVGCTREELVAHLEEQFLPGMSWENRSEWHIDHVLPCAAFDMLDPVHQRACFHYSNLQPLWGHDNLSKSDSYDPAEVAAWVARFSGEA